MKNVPPRLLRLTTLGHQLVVLFGEVMEALADGALLEEICHWGWALGVHSPAPLPIVSLLPVCD